MTNLTYLQNNEHFNLVMVLLKPRNHRTFPTREASADISNILPNVRDIQVFYST